MNLCFVFPILDVFIAPPLLFLETHCLCLYRKNHGRGQIQLALGGGLEWELRVPELCGVLSGSSQQFRASTYESGRTGKCRNSSENLQDGMPPIIQGEKKRRKRIALKLLSLNSHLLAAEARLLALFSVSQMHWLGGHLPPKAGTGRQHVQTGRAAPLQSRSWRHTGERLPPRKPGHLHYPPPESALDTGKRRACALHSHVQAGTPGGASEPPQSTTTSRPWPAPPLHHGKAPLPAEPRWWMCWHIIILI